MIGSYLLAPLLFSISSILTLYVHNIGELTLDTLVIPLIVTLILASLSYILFTFFFKQPLKASIFTSLFWILIFSYGDVTNTLVQFSVHDLVIFPIWISLFFIVFITIKKTPYSLVTFQKFLTIVSVSLALFSCMQIIQFNWNSKGKSAIKSPLVLPPLNSSLNKETLPDIYYIVPEDYSSPAVMKTYFHFDTSEFTNYLKKKGFILPESSTSNYPKSFLSVASTLNMEYLDYLSTFKNSSDQTLVTPLFEHNNVAKFLKPYGYTYYQMGSWWGPSAINPLADDNYTLEREHLTRLGEFNYRILETSVLKPFLEKILPTQFIGESDEEKRRRIIYQFETLPKVATKPGPKFIFVHIIAPHGPYVFGTQCEFLDFSQIWQNPEELNYINQSTCINKKLEKTIDQILTISSRPPVILLQSDEGAPFLGNNLNPPDAWSGANEELLREKFPTFSAYYLPGKEASLVYSNITPVNAFRLIFNAYFDAKLPLLPDKNYIFYDMNHLYEFHDVTSVVHPG